MAAGKWIPGLTPATPLAHAARTVLAVRLEVVRDHLDLALREADQNPEHVHQLRVGTRRAGAALKIFRCCLPEPAHQKARKHLRRLRRAAGAARDWDVFLMTLADTRPTAAKGQAGRDLLTGYALARRAAAQDSLEAAVAGHALTVEHLLAETVAAVRPPGEHHLRTLGDLAGPVLFPLVHKLYDAAAQDLADYDRLHRVRILGKRLRYAMEVFADCFAPAFRDRLYPAVEEMQEILGRANDSHVAAQRLTALRNTLRVKLPHQGDRFRPGVEELSQFHARRLPEERQRFLAWWEQWQQIGTETAFQALLLSSS
jgi:CHAD domain-containing protein